MPELTPTEPWADTTDPASGEPWRSSLVEALRANGFETSPPPIDDEADAWTMESAAAMDPGADRDALPPPTLDVDPGSDWWSDATALSHPDGVSSMVGAAEPLLPVAEPVVVRPAVPPVPFAVSAALAPPAVPAVTSPVALGTTPRAVNPPATPAAATPPSPPAFLAARIAGAAAPPVAPDMAPSASVQTAAEAEAAAPATPEPSPDATATVAPTAALPGPAAPSEVQAVPPEAPAAPATAPVPVEALPAGLDPRVALAWPEPKPLNDERWPTAPVLTITGAPVWSVDPTPGATDTDARGFSWDEPASAPLLQDPWAGVRFSATEPAPADVAPVAPDLSVPAAGAAAMAAAMISELPDGLPAPDAPVEDLAQLRAQAAATLMADAAGDAVDAAGDVVDDIGDALAEPAWPVLDESPVAVASPWGGPAPWQPAPWQPAPATEAAPERDAVTALEAEAVPREPAPATPDRTAPAAPHFTWEPTQGTPGTAAAAAVLADGSPVDLDPERVEFIGYADAATEAPAAAGAARPIIPPTGSILDVGRRPPGAKPVDPATLGTRSATSGGLTARESVPAMPGATGGDLWDLVTAPTPAAVPEAAPGRASRAVTILLSLLVALVIVALVVGFLYSFTGLL